MDVVLLLTVIVGAPIFIIGGVQISIWKLIGAKALRLFSSIIILICVYFLVAEASGPPVYGNKSALVGLGTFAVGILLIENLLILFAPLLRRFLEWDQNIQSAHVADFQS